MLIFKMQLRSALLLFASSCAAIVLENSVRLHEAATPFRKSALIQGGISLLGFKIFQRQFCPSFSIPCPNNICCSYSPVPTSCCGDTCCAFGSLCTGGTPDKPCCVAITDLTNTCGSQNSNVSRGNHFYPGPSSIVNFANT